MKNLESAVTFWFWVVWGRDFTNRRSSTSCVDPAWPRRTERPKKSKSRFLRLSPRREGGWASPTVCTFCRREFSCGHFFCPLAWFNKGRPNRFKPDNLVSRGARLPAPGESQSGGGGRRLCIPISFQEVCNTQAPLPFPPQKVQKMTADFENSQLLSDIPGGQATAGPDLSPHTRGRGCLRASA